MNNSFELLEPQAVICQKPKSDNTSFYASTVKRVPFVAASLSVVMSMVSFDCYSLDDKYRPVFVGVEPAQDELIVALGDDYEAQSKMLRRLDVLKDSLGDNWNGEGDIPIEEKAYNNAKTAILATPGAMLKHWRLFPNPNGTLLLSPKNKSIAGISIGNEDFSYAALASDDKQISGKEPFSEQAFKSALNQIHRILGYV